jgi:hypothetical protein|tara:strand:- start:120 stop:668 length:549 start_codon:yes stop_codon:yes gene_type:complete
MDPATLLFLANSGKAIFGFINTRNSNKQYLQELHTKRLVTILQAKKDINDRLDSSIEIQANNETYASAGGYDPFDSGSFKAIANQVRTKAKKDITSLELGMQIQTESIDRSLSNLNKQMRLNEIGLVANLGTTYASHNMYLRDQRYIETQRKLQQHKATLAQNKIRFADRYSRNRGYFYRPR